ncbi:MAG: methyltransferase [Rhizobiaceae bacterium]|nr:methyltransferase [Rhizobiaceae bacterium]MCV0406190.1 methyltransferase [Rhizobiaceae bacterium]
MGGDTLDAFHRGAFWLVQPATGAHRAGMDAMMLAAAVPGDFSGRLADLGAGAGAAGLAVAARCAHARVTLVERSPEMAAYARRTLEHPGNAAIASRAEILEADVALRGAARRNAGLDDRAFDFAIMNPPFNDDRHRPAATELRRDAHVMVAGLFESWLRCAAAIVKPGGRVALIARPASLGEVLTALSGRFGRARIVPIQPRADRAAIRIVIRAERGARAGPSLEPPLVLHEGRANVFTEHADAINNGRAALLSD